jgi:hypothetical protein
VLEIDPLAAGDEKAKGFAGLGGHLVNIYRLVIRRIFSRDGIRPFRST